MLTTSMDYHPRELGVATLSAACAAATYEFIVYRWALAAVFALLEECK